MNHRDLFEDLFVLEMANNHGGQPRTGYSKNRHPGQMVGLSTLEHADWEAAMLIAYAKGVRTLHTQVDIDAGGVKVSPYCSLPEQVSTWFKAYSRVKNICGGSPDQKRRPPYREDRISRLACLRHLGQSRNGRGICHKPPDYGR